MKDTDGRIIVGKIGATFGIRGWLKIRAYTEFGPTILTYQPWYLNKDNKEATPYSVEDGKVQSNGLIAKLAGIHTPEEARLLTGSTISILRSELKPLAANEFYWSDLIGLTVINQAGVAIGVVTHLMETGSNDVLVVKGSKEFAIPYLFGKTVLSVNLETKEIHVDWELL